MATIKFSRRGTTRIKIPAIRATIGCRVIRFTVMNVAPGLVKYQHALFRISNRWRLGEPNRATAHADDPGNLQNAVTFRRLRTDGLLDLRPNMLAA